jgi:hypothetical protein
LGSGQKPKSIEVVREAGRQSLVIRYERLRGREARARLAARFIFELEDQAREFR